MVELSFEVKCVIFRNFSFKGDLIMFEVRGECHYENVFKEFTKITYGPKFL